jgi:hypothetical protein
VRFGGGAGGHDRTMTHRPPPAPEQPPPDADGGGDGDGEGQRSTVPDALGAQPTGDDAAKPAAEDDDGEPDGRAY